MDAVKIIHAIRFATEKHGSQKRKSRNSKHVPYMIHPLEVAEILMKYGELDNCGPSLCEDLIIAGILHDTLEDTDATEDDIRNLFGNYVVNYVKELTDDQSLTKEEQRKKQLEKMLNASWSARVIKIADKTSNIRDLVRSPPGWKLSSVKGYCEHGTQVVSMCCSKQDMPQSLVAQFWNARKELLDWIAEEELNARKELLDWIAEEELKEKQNAEENPKS